MYTKKYINETDYKILYTPEKGGFKTVNENQDLFQKWISEGNEPKIISYVTPVIQDKNKADLLSLVIQKIRKNTLEILNQGFEFEGVLFSMSEPERNRIGQWVLFVKSDLNPLPDFIGNHQDEEVKITQQNFNSFVNTGFGFVKQTIKENRKLIKEVKNLTKTQLKTWVDPRDN